MSGALSKPSDMIAAAAAWFNYERSLRKSNRYVVKDSTYFEDLVTGCLECSYDMGPDWTLYRARIMPVDQQTDTEPLKLKDMGAPSPDKATQGRLNPDGISCFYAAMELETAIAEVRP